MGCFIDNGWSEEEARGEKDSTIRDSFSSSNFPPRPLRLLLFSLFQTYKAFVSNAYSRKYLELSFAMIAGLGLTGELLHI